MKKIFAFFALLLLWGCVEAGEFTPKRHRMHDLNRTETCANVFRGQTFPGKISYKKSTFQGAFFINQY